MSKFSTISPAAFAPEVVIVGCGPVGALAANLLGVYGVRTLVLDREPGIIDIPRAVHFDDEVMRVFQAVGLDAEVRAKSIRVPGMDLVTAKGRPLMQMRTADVPRDLGHDVTSMFHQPHLEAVLRQGVERFPHVELRCKTEVEAIEPECGFVRVRCSNGETTYTVEAAYVFGCDGARSMARKVIGAELDDLGLHQPWLVIDLLMKRDCGLPEVAQQICNPRRPATMVPMPAPRRRWEFMLVDGDDPERIVQNDRVQELVKPWVSPADYSIERSAIYTFHGLIARPWRRGRAFLLGDAAHQMPPFLGQGMCAGIRDAFNLCWKIERVLRSGAPESLLDTYESERRPHVALVVDSAVKIGRIIQSRSLVLGAVRNVAFRLSNLFNGRGAVPRSISTIPLGPGAFADDVASVRRVPFPQPIVVSSKGEVLLDEVLGSRAAVLAHEHNPQTLMSRNLAQRAESAGLQFIEISNQGIANGAIVDKTGRLAEWFRARGADVAIVRPDRVPFAATRAEAPGSADGILKAYLARSSEGVTC